MLAVECLSQIEVDRTDANFTESSYSNVAESIINRLFLYFDDPYIKLRPILLGNNGFQIRWIAHYKIDGIQFDFQIRWHNWRKNIWSSSKMKSTNCQAIICTAMKLTNWKNESPTLVMQLN